MFILYSTLACHLCDHAKAVLDHCQTSYEVVDIADDDELFERYGIRIPVVYDPRSTQEIGWPFDPESFMAWREELPDSSSDV